MLKFSRWSKWNQRGSNLENGKCPGVYAIAISNTDMAGKPFRYTKEIVYFGMTNSRGGIFQRLDQFNKQLFGSEYGVHGGAQRVRHKHKDAKTLTKKLYVAICPFKCDVKSIARKDLLAMGNVARAEYLALANYAERFERLPEFNDKARSLKK
jgi:hypothetical protein